MNTLVKRYRVTCTFTEPLLGSQPQRDVASEYLLDKAVKAGQDVTDELETLPEELQKSSTAFHKDNGHPILWDYQIRGFLKEWGLALNGLEDVKNLRSKIDNYVYVFPRKIPLVLPEGGELGWLERPLRAMTAQGPRVALARSEVLPEGTTISYEIRSLKGVIRESLLRELLDMGQYKGQGQWRNGSYGRFSYEMEEIQ